MKRRSLLVTLGLATAVAGNTSGEEKPSQQDIRPEDSSDEEMPSNCPDGNLEEYEHRDDRIPQRP